MANDTEKALRLLAYLKKYTDKSNPTSMPLIDYYFKEKGYPDFFGTANSKRRSKRELIKKLVGILNTDIHGNPLPKDEWVIMYDGLDEENKKDRNFICNLYYNQPFTARDVDDIVNSIEKNDRLNAERKKELTDKVYRHAANKNYTHHNAAIRRGMSATLKKRFLVERKQNKARLNAYIQKKKEYYDY